MKVEKGMDLKEDGFMVKDGGLQSVSLNGQRLHEPHINCFEA